LHHKQTNKQATYIFSSNTRGSSSAGGVLSSLSYESQSCKDKLAYELTLSSSFFSSFSSLSFSLSPSFSFLSFSFSFFSSFSFFFFCFSSYSFLTLSFSSSNSFSLFLFAASSSILGVQKYRSLRWTGQTKKKSYHINRISLSLQRDQLYLLFHVSIPHTF